MVAEGELRSNVDDSDRVRELQDKVVDLKAEVSIAGPIPYFVPLKRCQNGDKTSYVTFSSTKRVLHTRHVCFEATIFNEYVLSLIHISEPTRPY